MPARGKTKSTRKGRGSGRKTSSDGNLPLQLAARFAEKLINLAEDEQNTDLPGSRERHMLAVAHGESTGDRYGSDGLNDRYTNFAKDVYDYLKLYASSGTNSPAPLCEVLEAAAETGAMRPYANGGGTGDRGNVSRAPVGELLDRAAAEDAANMDPFRDVLDNLAGEAIPGVSEEQVGMAREILEAIILGRGTDLDGTSDP